MNSNNTFNSVKPILKDKYFKRIKQLLKKKDK